VAGGWWLARRFELATVWVEQETEEGYALFLSALFDEIADPADDEMRAHLNGYLPRRVSAGAQPHHRQTDRQTDRRPHASSSSSSASPSWHQVIVNLPCPWLLPPR
jgi:hypothetical protein